MASNSYIQNAFPFKGFELDVPTMPNLTSGLTSAQLTGYFGQFENNNANPNVTAYSHGAGSVVVSAYRGGVYVPTQNRIYFMPAAICNQATWHYVDCNTGTIVAYTHGGGTTLASNAYIGGVYDPVFDRIMLCPYVQATSTTWHYIDVSTVTPNLVSYTGLNLGSSQFAGVYDPLFKRVFLTPSGGTSETSWYYIDCSASTPVVRTYVRPNVGVSLGSYQGAVYSPIQKRVYFVPHSAAGIVDPYTQLSWYYVDCSTSTPVAVAYPAPGNSIVNGYSGGVYSPLQNRIYFVPFAEADETYWHYIDCKTGDVVSYTNNSGVVAVNNGYLGGVYSPANNRIYFVPYSQSDQTYWHYIDCATGNVVAYKPGVTNTTTPAPGAYIGGVLSPLQNRIYLSPMAQATSSTWHYILNLSTQTSDVITMAQSVFNKY